jgi:hypothetical protein
VGIFSKYAVFPLLTDVFKWHDTTLIMIDAGGCAIQNVINALAGQTWLLYLGGIIGILDDSTNELLR